MNEREEISAVFDRIDAKLDRMPSVSFWLWMAVVMIVAIGLMLVFL